MAFGSPTIGEWLNAARERLAFLEAQADGLKREREEYQAEVERLGTVLERTWQELTGHLLPDVDDDALRALEQRLRYGSGLLPNKRRFDERLERSQQARAELEASDDFRNLELYLAQVTDELAELQEAYDALKAELTGWRSCRQYAELEQRGWFSPGYRPDGLLAALRDWRSVSFLMAQLESVFKASRLRLRNPAQVRASYEDLRRRADPVIEAYTDLQRRQTRLGELKARHEELVRAPGVILQELYEALGEALRGHLEACDDELRLALAENDPDLAAYFTKLKGLAKQIDYLKQLSVARIDAHLQKLEEQIARLAQKIRKMEYKRARRKRVTLAASDIERLRDLKANSWQKRRAGLASLRIRVGGFDGYAQGSFLEDYLWWDLLTRGARGDDLYEVRVFHERHPEWDYRSYSAPWQSRRDDAHGSALDRAALGLAGEMHDRDEAGSALGDLS